jgi:hypothetical protein
MKRGPPGTVGGLPSTSGIGCPTTANWEALSVAINTIEPTEVRVMRNLVTFFILTPGIFRDIFSLFLSFFFPESGRH